MAKQAKKLEGKLNIAHGKEEDAVISTVNKDGIIKVKVQGKEVNAEKGPGVQDIQFKNGDKVKIQHKGKLALIVSK